MNRTSTRRSIARSWVWVLLVLSFAGCRPSKGGRTYPPSATFIQRSELGRFTEHGVEVAVWLESDVDGRSLLRATFRPVEQGFHLYGKDMPEGGIKGVGVPTRFEVSADSSVIVAGPTFSDIAPQDVRIDVLDVTLPIYKDGPVTLRIPIDFSQGRDNSARLSFSYMACKTDGVCLRAVKGKMLQVNIPRP